MDAAITLMGTRGAAACTVTAVCAHSGVTTRYFYQHFQDRNGLLQAVFAEIYEAFQAAIVEAIPARTASPDELAYAPIAALVQMIEGDRRMGRILFVESGAEPLLREMRSGLMSNFADLVVREARSHFEIPNATVAVADLAATHGVGGLFEVLRRWLEQEIDFSVEELIKHCAGFLGSLGVYTLSQRAEDAATPKEARKQAL
jgi:AcrR family transcriptional regulator